MTECKGYVSKQAACDEIARFIGYLDEDMINRLQIAIKRLPDADVLDGSYDRMARIMREMEEGI